MVKRPKKSGRGLVAKPVKGRERTPIEQHVDAAIRSVSFPSCPFHTKIKRDRKSGKFQVTIDIVDRKTGEPACAQFGWNLPVFLSSTEHAVDWIYQCVRETWVHELNEIFFVDGKRRRDLHDAEWFAILPPEEVAYHELSAFKIQLAAFLGNHWPGAALARAEGSVSDVLGMEGLQPARSS